MLNTCAFAKPLIQGGSLLNYIVLIEPVAALRAELRRILGIFGLPSALVATEERRVSGFLFAAVLAEFAFVYCAAFYAGPAFLGFRFLLAALGAEFSGGFGSALRALPCACGSRFLCAALIIAYFGIRILSNFLLVPVLLP